jgi:hypothetical protein
MSKLAERLNENSQRVRENEKRIVAQLAFVERLQASGRSTRSAEEALEVMRRLLSDLYQTRMALRRQAMPAGTRSAAAQKTNRARKGNGKRLS